VLRSGKRSRYYLDKYRFETRPDLLAALGERIAAAVGEHEPEAVRLAAPVLGASSSPPPPRSFPGCRSS
jgi:orotate phosphoribosyltransferase